MITPIPFDDGTGSPAETGRFGNSRRHWPHLTRFGVAVAAAVSLALATLAFTAGCTAHADEPPTGPEPGATVTLHHIDVGQADATLIQGPDGTILIDAGHWQRNEVVPYLKAAEVEVIDLVVLTHPHADHIGQIPAVLEAFEVTEVWMTGWEHESQTLERALDAVLASDAGYHEPRAGETQAFGELVVEVVHPVEPLTDVHDNLAVRVVFGDFAALYTGDAEVRHEVEMTERDLELGAQVLQLGHSTYATSGPGLTRARGQWRTGTRR